MVNFLVFLLVFGQFGVKSRIPHDKLYILTAGQVCRSKIADVFIFSTFLNFVFLNFSTLVEEIGYFRPQIRILREKSSYGSSSEVWKPEIYIKNVKINVLICFCLSDHGVNIE